jgi:hypothetical protein
VRKPIASNTSARRASRAVASSPMVAHCRPYRPRCDRSPHDLHDLHDLLGHIGVEEHGHDQVGTAHGDVGLDGDLDTLIGQLSRSGLRPVPRRHVQARAPSLWEAGA